MRLCIFMFNVPNQGYFLRLTQSLCYAILFAHQNRAASSMAEQAPLKRKVQGSTPWQPTSVESAKHPAQGALLILTQF